MLPLGDDATVVIRFGTEGWDPTSLLKSMLEDQEDGMPMNLSVAVGPSTAEVSLDRDIEAICRVSGGPWGSLRSTSIGRLTEAGFQVLDERESWEAPNHCHVRFPADVTESTCKRFIECFAAPMDNPVPKSERRRSHA